MDETIGVKGGKRDFKRTFLITKKQKEKLKQYEQEKELKELEKEVKRKQKFVLIKTLPIVIIGNTFKTLDNKSQEKTSKTETEEIQDIKERKNSNPIKETKDTKKVIIVLADGKKQIIEIPKSIEINKDIIEVQQDEKKEEKQNKEKEKELKEENVIQEEKQNKEVVKEIKQENIPIPIVKEEKNINKEKSNINIEELSEKQRNKLQKLQARKIIDVYEKNLKDIRYELRNLIIDYNTLIDQEDKTIKKSEEEEILDRLNEIIRKIEILKEKIKIEDLDKYDDNYIYTLIEEYLEDFKDKKIVKEIKDSPLYIAISSKLDEIDKKKDKFKDKVEEKKEELENKEEDFDKLKEKYSKIDKINKEIEDFYYEQQQRLKELEEKINNSVTITEKVEVQLEAMNKSTRKLLRKLSIMMFIPGKRGANALNAITSIYANMAKQMLNPKTVSKKYKVIEVKDYSKDIIDNLNKLDDVKTTLRKNSNDIDKLISSIKEEFFDYIGVIKECDELLSNLEKVKTSIKEKEYEIEKIKEKEEKELERNNAKVLTKGQYPM